MKGWMLLGMKGRLFVWVLLLLVTLVQCRDSVPTTNKVISIEPAALDMVLGANNFNGLVVFMASWCPPCREELPVVSKLYNQYHGQGINIVAISLDADGPGAVQPLINQLQVPFPVYWVGAKASQHYKIVGIPTMFVVKMGEVVEKLPGLHSKKTIESKIKELMP